MSGARLGLVVNPTSGAGRGAVHGAAVRTALAARGHDVVMLSGSTRAEAVERARAAVREVDALVVVGGDGMANLGAGVVLGTDVPLGLVAAGSGNDLARAAGLPRHDVSAGVAALERALDAGGRRIDAIRSTRGGLGARPHDTGEHTAGGTADVSLCVVSAGLDAAVSARAAAAQAAGREGTAVRAPEGSRYLRALAAEVRAFRPYSYRITVDGETWETTGTLVAVASTPTFGGGLKIAPQARFDDGVLDVVLAGPLSRWGVVRLFPRLYPGTHGKHPAVTMLRATSVVLEPGPGGPPPPEAHADGEPLAPLPLRLDVLPGAVRLLA